MLDATAHYDLLLGSLLLATGMSTTLGLLLRDPTLVPFLRRQSEALDNDLRALMRPRIGLWIIRSQVLMLSALVALAWLQSVAWLFGTPVVALLPLRLLQKRRVERAAALEAQLDSFLLALTNSLKASPALGSALEAIVPLAPDPIRSEFDWALRAFDLGTPLDEALSQLAARVPSGPLATAITMLNIARRTGGDLSQSLETCAASLREMARLEGVVRTKTASGKAQAVAIGIVPLPLVGLLHSIDPGFLAPLLETFTGHLLVALSVALWATAIALANWIVAVDI